MTTIEGQCEPTSQPRRIRRFSKLLLALAVVATIAAAATAAARRHGFAFGRNTFQEALDGLARGDYAAVRHFVRKFEAAQPSSPYASFLRGAMLVENGYGYPALDELGKARQEKSLETASLTLMGEAWYRLGRHVEAQAALQEVLKREPDSLEAHRWLAASYYDQGVVGMATEHLHRTAELDPSDPRPHRLLGLMHKDFGQYEAAIPLYEESLRRGDDREDADEIRQELASCQVETRSYSDALKTLEKCPERPEFDVLRAQCHHAQGHPDRAKEVLARALEVQGDNLDGLLLQGTMMLEEGKARAAIEVFLVATKAHPKDYTAHFLLSQAYNKAGEQDLADREQAVAEKIRVIRQEFAQLHKRAWQNPNDAQARLRLATLARELDRPDLADVWLRSAAALQPAVADQEDR